MPHRAFKASAGAVSRARGNGPRGRAALIAPGGTAAIVRRFRAGFSASRRGGRVAEGARLESVWAGNRLVGSNPTPSASPMFASVRVRSPTHWAHSQSLLMRSPLFLPGRCKSPHSRWGECWEATDRMARQINRLNAQAVKTLRTRGRHADGGGLYLVIDKNSAKRWVFLYRDRRTQKLREMGFGGVTTVPLVKAREKAAEARAQLAAGRDPLCEKKASASEDEVTPRSFGSGC